MPSNSIQMTLTIGLLLNAQNRLPLPSFPNSSGVRPKCILTRLNHFTPFGITANVSTGTLALTFSQLPSPLAHSIRNISKLNSTLSPLFRCTQHLYSGPPLEPNLVASAPRLMYRWRLPLPGRDFHSAELIAPNWRTFL